MLLYGLVFWLLTWMVAATVVLQLVLTLLAGEPNAEMLRLASLLSRYTSEVIDFLTFVSDRLPFPVSPLPDPNRPVR
jgi:hypothetical protein